MAVQLAAELSPQQQRAFLDAAVAGRPLASIGDMLRVPAPSLGEAPERVRGFRVRLDLVGAKPPVWRRLVLPGDLTLDRLHLVIQAAMGWLDGHLHRFRTGSDQRSPYFVTSSDLEEGDEDDDAVVEDGVRLDRVLSRSGDRLWYEYDFGDGWEHVLKVEEVTDEPPAEVACTDGRMACPPEDCGGIWSYAELAAWVRAGCDPSSVPSPFEDLDHARGWLPPGWHPDHFDIADAQVSLATVFAVPVPVAGELAELVQRLERRGDWTLTQLLTRSASHGVVEVGEAEAARLVEPFIALLDAIAGGVRLTSAGYLPPAVVEQLAERIGVTGWWIGKANREDLTWPVAELRNTARALGLIALRHGRLSPTAVARRVRDQPLTLWKHVVSRLPAGSSAFDRQSGWMALAVVASGVPAEEWDREIRALVVDLGWRIEGGGLRQELVVDNPTLDVLELFSGKARHGRLTGHDAAVGATARAAITRPS